MSSSVDPLGRFRKNIRFMTCSFKLHLNRLRKQLVKYPIVRVCRFLHCLNQPWPDGFPTSGIYDVNDNICKQTKVTKRKYLPHEDLTAGRQLTGGQQDVKQNGGRGYHGRRGQQYVPTLTRRSTLKKSTRRSNVPTLTRRTVMQMSTRRSDQQTTKRIGCSFSERGQIISLVWRIYE